MTRKNVIRWISGGALLLGYAAFWWLQRRRVTRTADHELRLPHADGELNTALDRLDQITQEAALGSEPDSALLEPANTDHSARGVDPGPHFLGRATSALSPFERHAARTSTSARKF